MTAPTSATAPADTPDLTHPSYDAMSAPWSRIRDLLGGTDAVRAKGEAYLPKHPAETGPDYEVRRKLGVLYNGFARTLSAMTGLVCQRDVALGEDNNALVVAQWENIDGRGTHGSVFTRRLFRDGLAMGTAGILVDPPVIDVDPGRVLSKREERTLGVRPYWKRYRAEDIRDWGFTEYQGRQVLAHLVLRESYFRRKGRFRSELATDYRVLTWTGPGEITSEVWTETSQNGQKTIVLTGKPRAIVGPTYLPFAVLAAGETSDDDPFVTRPPLLDLADLNLTHYRTDTDRRNLLRLGCLPVPVRVGYHAAANEPVQAIGPNVMLDVPIYGNFFWAAPPADAFAPTMDDLNALERRMAALGLAFLQSDTRAAETAEAKRLDTTAQNASLSNAARALQDCVETALGFQAEYLQVDPGSASVNFDFERTVMDAMLIGALNTVRTSGNLSLETFLGVLHRGRVLGDDFDVNAEIARVLAGDLPPVSADDDDDEIEEEAA